MHEVVIVGGGFGGMNAAHALKDANVHVTLVDRRNFHLFQPLLYQVATAVLSPGEIASPLRLIFRKQKNVSVLMTEVTGFDVAARRVLLKDGDSLPYDTLILATGSRHAYFGHDDWEPFAPGLKTVEDALDIRRRVFTAYETAEREDDSERRRAWLTFVVVGGGPTGVELAGALSEIATLTVRDNYKRVDLREVRVLLIEAEELILPTYPPSLAKRGQRQLERLGVTVRTGARVTAIDESTVTIATKEGSEVIPARTVVWAAGVQASRLGRIMCEQAGCETDRAGRVTVNPDLTVPDHPEIFVIGDLARFLHQGGKPLPGVAPVAIQQGGYVAKLIRARMVGRALPPFHYRDKGSMATIGRAAGIAQIGPLRLSGYPAWLAWLFIHLLYIVEFENRLLILIQWAWTYFTRNRGARLITGRQPPTP
jgi:NADH:ubiquinone reductase (H+-translocating)